MPGGKIFMEGRLQIPWPMLVEGEPVPLSGFVLSFAKSGSSSDCWLDSVATFCAWRYVWRPSICERASPCVPGLLGRTVLLDEIGFVFEFAVGMRFPRQSFLWPNSFSGVAFVAARRGRRRSRR